MNSERLQKSLFSIDKAAVELNRLCHLINILTESLEAENSQLKGAGMEYVADWLDKYLSSYEICYDILYNQTSVISDSIATACKEAASADDPDITVIGESAYTIGAPMSEERTQALSKSMAVLKEWMAAIASDQSIQDTHRAVMERIDQDDEQLHQNIIQLAGLIAYITLTFNGSPWGDMEFVPDAIINALEEALSEEGEAHNGE